MQQIDTLLAQFLQGRSLYAPVRRLLNLVFVCSLASYLYVFVYGPYRIFEWSERDAIINFFVSGEFIIPFCLFTIVYYVTQWIPVMLFGIVAYFIRIKIVRALTRKRVAKRKVRKWVNMFIRYSHYTPKPLTKDEAVTFMEQFVQHLTPEEVVKLEKEMEEPLKLAEANMILFFRTALAITIYFHALPHFGWRLYTLVLGVLIYALLMLISATVILKVLPPFFNRVRVEMEHYVVAHANKKLEQK